MNNYILELLQANERVIIPDFGAFMKKKDTDVIYFNEYLKFNDNLFIGFVIQKDNIEKNLASQKVKDFVAAIRTKLEEDKTYEIEGLGFITTDEKGRLKFEQAGKVKDDKKPVSKEKDKAKIDNIKESVVDQAKNVKKNQEKDKTNKVPVKEEKKVESKTKQKEEKVKTDVEKVKDDAKTDSEVEKVKGAGKKEEKKADNTTPGPISLEIIAQEKKKSKDELVVEKPKDKKAEVKKEQPVKKEKKPKEKPSKKEKPPKQVKVKKEKPPKKNKPPKKEGDKKKSKWWLWLIIIIFVVLAGAVAFSFIKPDIVCKYVELPYLDCNDYLEDDAENQGEHESEVSEDIETHDEAEVLDTLEAAIDTLSADTLELIEEVVEETEVAEEVEEVVEEVETVEVEEKVQTPPSGKKFYLVAGCFENENNANKLVNELKGQGYSAMIFGRVGRLHGVCYNYYNSRQEALKEMNKVGGNAWVLYK